MPEKILVVDDNPVNRKILAAMLNREGYLPLEAADGPEALHLAALEDPDMILLDIMMPAMDGFEVCQELKSNPHFADTPVLFLSALDQAADKVKGLELGAADYITKPFQHIEVLARVRNNLRARRQARYLKRTKEAIHIYAKKLHDDMQSASEVQNKILPPRRLKIRGFEAAWKQSPISDISGEMPGILQVDESRTAVYLFDTGLSGLSGAMAAVALAKAIHAMPGGVLRPKLEGAPGFAPALPSQVLGSLDKQFSFSDFGALMSLGYLLMDVPTGMLHWANTGHPYPVLLRAGQEPRVLEGHLPPESTTRHGGYKEGEMVLRKRDRIFLFTDGLINRSSRAGVPFGWGRLAQTLGRIQGKDLEEALQTVEQAVLCHADGAAAVEDATWMLLEYQ